MWTTRGTANGVALGILVATTIVAAAATEERNGTGTLKQTINRGAVLCGVGTGLPGFSTPAADGVWNGFDVDFCRAVA
ncbi:MAG: transporter, amino acid binding protein, partial [Tardiphaga sp.]|nr:transporter, amino acid binding protein [Tardiphaga sp.]